MGRQLKKGLDWFRLDTGFSDHPKVMRLSQDLKVSLVMARGLLVTLWCWVGRYYPSGVLKGVKVGELALAAGYGGRKPFADLLLTHGFLDKVRGGTLRVHGWSQRHSPDLRRREAARERMRRVRAKAPGEQEQCAERSREQDANTSGTRRQVRTECALTGPNRTGTRPDQTSKPDTGSAEASPQRKKGKHRGRLAALFDHRAFPDTAEARGGLISQLAQVLTEDGAARWEDERKWRAVLIKALQKQNPVGWAVDVLGNGRWQPADEDLDAAKAEMVERANGKGETERLGEVLP